MFVFVFVLLVYSDLIPTSAPIWEVQCKTEHDDITQEEQHQNWDNAPVAAAFRELQSVVEQGAKLASISSVLDKQVNCDSVSPGSSRAVSTVLSTLTSQQPSPYFALNTLGATLKQHIESATLNAIHGENIPADVIDAISREIFDAETDEQAEQTAPEMIMDGQPGWKCTQCKSNNTEQQIICQNCHTARSIPPASPLYSPHPLPSTPFDPHSLLVPNCSILSLLVWRLLHTYHSGYLSVRTVALLWTEFLNELRFHFETSIPIPRLYSEDIPDFQYCLIHQKLQLLQRCIRINTKNKEGANTRKEHMFQGMSREDYERTHSSVRSRVSTSSVPHSNPTPNWASWNNLDDDLQSFESNELETTTEQGWGDIDIDIDIDITDADADTKNTNNKDSAHADVDTAEWGDACSLDSIVPTAVNVSMSIPINATSTETGWGDLNLDIDLDENSIGQQPRQKQQHNQQYKQEEQTEQKQKPEGVKCQMGDARLLL